MIKAGRVLKRPIFLSDFVHLSICAGMLLPDVLETAPV